MPEDTANAANLQSDNAMEGLDTSPPATSSTVAPPGHIWSQQQGSGGGAVPTAQTSPADATTVGAGVDQVS